MENWYTRYRDSGFNTYRAHFIGCSIIWAVIMAVAVTMGSEGAPQRVLLILFGWLLGWVSATIARSVSRHPGARPAAP